MDIRIADALKELPNIPTQSVDGIITDPPYGVSSKISWDQTQITVAAELWNELFRVLKPGAFLLCFADPRRFHLVASAAERAGFEIRTPLSWQYRASLPKTHKASRLIDVNAKVEPREIGTMNRIPINDEFRRHPKTSRSPTLRVLAPTSVEAKKFAGQYLGDGTVQRAGEPILLVQRPPGPGLKIDSLKRHLTGAINVEEYRTRYREWPTTVFNVPRPSQIEVAGCPHPTPKPLDLIRKEGGRSRSRAIPQCVVGSSVGSGQHAGGPYFSQAMYGDYWRLTLFTVSPATRQRRGRNVRAFRHGAQLEHLP